MPLYPEDFRTSTDPDTGAPGDPEGEYDLAFERLFASGKKGRIVLDAKDYVMRRPLVLPRPFTLQGEGGQWGAAAASKLIFRGAKDGVIVEQGATESSLSDFAIIGPWTGESGDGLTARTRIRAERLYVQGFTRDAYHFESVERLAEGVNWNLNNSYLENLSAWRAGRCGLYIDGVNANSIVTLGLNFKECCRLTPPISKDARLDDIPKDLRAASLYDSGFTGNKHTNPVVHTTISSARDARGRIIPLPAYWLDDDSATTVLDSGYAEFNSAPSIIRGNSRAIGGVLRVDPRSDGIVVPEDSALWRMLRRKTNERGFQVPDGLRIRTERDQELFLGRHDVQLVCLPGAPVNPPEGYKVGDLWIREDPVEGQPDIYRLKNTVLGAAWVPV